MKLDRLKKKPRIILLLLLVIILSLKLIISPFISHWQSINWDLKAKEAKFYRALKLISEKEKIDRAYRMIAEKIDARELLEGNEDNVESGVYRFLSKIAEESNVKLRALNPKKSKALLYFDIQAEADLEGFWKFLYYLENSSQPFSLEELAVTPYATNILLFRIKIKKILL